MKIWVLAGVCALISFSVSLSLQSAEYLEEDLDDRIIGGYEATQGMFKYQTAIFIENRSNGSMVGFCNGALVSPDYVLTLAHCIPEDLTGLQITVWFGALNISATTESGREINSVDFLFIHPEFDRASLANDIAVLHLQERVAPAPFVSPIRMAPPSDVNETYQGETLRTCGWGARMDLGALTEFSEILQYADNVGENITVCENYYATTPEFIIDETKICLSTTGARGPCKNDEGAPLSFQQDNTDTLVGLFALGNYTNCIRSAPVVYTRVASHWDFITDVTGLTPS
ncbi:brachyurin-like isoform X1 [Cloeon dipterum]|uniref:brachyurin-like isoform X1 n=1 Tax=Cloeon dipterum TaxID=197152 RepID=UPI00322059D8